MTNERNNEELTDVSSLISLLERTQLTLGEQIALEEQIALKYERLSHRRNLQNFGTKETTAFCTYVALIDLAPHLLGNAVDFILDKELDTEEHIEEVLMYMRTGIVPYQLWTAKVVEDLKENTYLYTRNSRTGMLTTYLARVMRCSLVGFNKLVRVLKEEFEDDSEVMRAVSFQEARYMEIPDRLKNDYFKLIKTDNAKEAKDYYDNEISLFSECVFDMMNKPLALEALTDMAHNKDFGLFHVYWSDMRDLEWFSMDFYVGKYQVMNHNENIVVGNETTGVPVGDGSVQQIQQAVGGVHSSSGMSVFPITLLGWSAQGKTPEEVRAIIEARENENERVLKSSEETPKAGEVVEEQHEEKNPTVLMSNRPSSWVVLKVAKDSSNRIMSRKRFTTKEEAVQFKEDVLKDSPELQEKFEFKVEPSFD